MQPTALGKDIATTNNGQYVALAERCDRDCTKRSSGGRWRLRAGQSSIEAFVVDPIPNAELAQTEDDL